MAGLVILALTFVGMWFFIVLPQQRRVRAHRELVASLNVGDEVMTTAGLFGTITELDEREARLEVAPGVELRFARDAIVRHVTDAPGLAAADGELGVERSDADDET